MNTIYNIYTECGDAAICSTPGNTIGMGNPMVPGDEGACKLGEPGTESLAAKTKTEKKPRKSKKDIKEGILDDPEINMANGDKLFELIEWYKTQRKYAKESTDKQDVKLLLERVTLDKNTLIIDCKDCSNEIVDEFYIKDNLPKGINTIKVLNAKTGFGVYSFVNDLTHIDFEVYRDNGQTYGNIMFNVKIKAGTSFDLGNITCDRFGIYAPQLESLLIGKDSLIIEFALGMCKKLERFYGSMGGAATATLPFNLVKYQLCEKGVLSWGADLQIVGK